MRLRNRHGRLGRAAALLVAALSTGVVPALAPTPVLAATPRLTLIGATTYDVLPDEHRVAVHVELTAMNHMQDTVTRKYFFRTATLTVLPGASGFRIAGGTGTPKVSVASRQDDYTNIRVDFGANLASGKSVTLDLDFELLDEGGAPDRPVRISPSIVTFSAWAFATPETPGATVAVRMPEGYDVTIGRGPLNGPAADPDGVHLTWSSGELATPLEFIADIAADRGVQYEEAAHSVPLAERSANVLVRSWPDDTAWRDRVADLVERGLPAFERQIGVPWPVDTQLVVQESLVRGLGGYAGVFDPAAPRIEVAYTASDEIVLHELAHAWFNGRLLADRWAAEAFASFYADRVAQELGVARDGRPAVEAEDAIPLNAWVPTADPTDPTDRWATSAAFDLAEEIELALGPEGLQRVLARAADHVAAYQPAVDVREPFTDPPDWRVLLDLAQDETGVDLSDTWRRWVTRPEDTQLLVERAAARTALADTQAHAGAWQLPPEIRAAMRAWQFDAARERLAAADTVLGDARALEAAARAAEVTLPTTVRARFEGATIAEASAELVAERTTVDAIAAAIAAQPGERGVVEAFVTDVGLLTVDPATDLVVARSAISSGDLAGAFAAAQSAEAAWANAAQVGRSRIVSAALLLLALVLFAGILRGERRKRAAGQAAAVAAPE